MISTLEQTKISSLFENFVFMIRQESAERWMVLQKVLKTV